MRKLLLAFLLFLAFPALALRAQVAQDDFLGRMDVTCPAPAHKVPVTCSQTGTTQTCQILNATIVADAVLVNDYDVTVSSPGTFFLISIGGPERITGTSTSMDETYIGGHGNNGTSLITAVNTGTATLTMTAAHSTGTIGATAGFLQPDRYYTSNNIITPNGTLRGLCTPEGHYVYLQAMSNGCDALSTGQCSFQYAGTGASDGSTVTISVTNSSNILHLAQGQKVTVSGCSDANYNGTQQITALTGNTTFTYADALAGPSATGCLINGFGWLAKYGGTACLSAQGLTTKWKTFGFNAIGEVSEATFDLQSGSCNNTTYLPILQPGTTPSFNLYSSANLQGYASQPVKSITFAVDRSLPTGFANAELDWFDGRWFTFALGYFNWHAGSGGVGAAFQSPSMYGMMYDDSDFQGFTRGAPYFHSIPAGHNVHRPGYITAITSPHQTASNCTNSSFCPGYTNSNTTPPYLYPDDTVYAKTLSASPPSSCSDAAPCNWPDWVRNKYTTTGAMNAAWGSPYTTFGSSETAVAGASISCANMTCSATLSGNGGTPDITPLTLHVFLTPSGGSPIMISGDCFAFGSGCSAAAGKGQFLRPQSCKNLTRMPLNFVCTDSNNDIETVTTAGTTAASTVFPSAASCQNTPTTSGSVVFNCVGPAIVSAGGVSTITYTSGLVAITLANAIPAGEVMTISYTWCGWDSGCGTGLEDEDGAHTTVTGTNPINFITYPAWSIGQTYTAYKSIVQVTIGGLHYWQMATSTGISQGATPTWSATLGTNAVDGGGNTWQSLGVPVSDPVNGDFTVAINANPQWGLDVAAWEEQFAAKYISTGNAIISLLHPDLLDFGVNFGSNDWATPTTSEILTVETQYSDVGFWALEANGDQQAALDLGDPLKQQFSTFWYLKPIVIEEFEGTSSGWQHDQNCANIPHNCWNGTVARAQGFYSQIAQYQGFKAVDGTFPYTGITWWQNQDGVGGALGLEDSLDNDVDGVSNVTATNVACPWGAGGNNCGGELATVPWLNINATTCSHCLTDALALWLQPFSGPSGPQAPTSVSGSPGRVKKWIWDWITEGVDAY